MRNACDFTFYLMRHLVVSAEFLTYVVSYWLYIKCKFVQGLFLSATSETDYILYVAGLLTLLCGYICYQIKDILWPNEENKSVLLEWPGYQQVKACCIAAIMHACIPVFITVILILLPVSLPHGAKTYLLLTFIVAMAFDALSCLLAPISLSQILSEAKGDDCGK